MKALKSELFKKALAEKAPVLLNLLSTDEKTVVIGGKLYVIKKVPKA